MISSRTPEGLPHRCPVCRQEVCLEPAPLFGDAPCPHCGHLLWFITLNSETWFFDFDESQPLRAWFIQRLAHHLGVSENAILDDPQYREKLELDSLDVVELVMEFEEEIDRGQGDMP